MRVLDVRHCLGERRTVCAGERGAAGCTTCVWCTGRGVIGLSAQCLCMGLRGGLTAVLSRRGIPAGADGEGCLWGCERARSMRWLL